MSAEMRILTGLPALTQAARGAIVWDVSVLTSMRRACAGLPRRSPCRPGEVEIEPADHALRRSRDGWTTRTYLAYLAAAVPDHLGRGVSVVVQVEPTSGIPAVPVTGGVPREQPQGTVELTELWCETVGATTDSAQQESGTGASPDYVRHNARPLSTRPLDGTFLTPDGLCPHASTSTSWAGSPGCATRAQPL
ncbi:transposase [Rhodococcus sp. NPDC127530]|uniref:transposase n=1 Tax=unclassified Rhodococcus (in: high G+C Gram-positive bacteria) TaxID=192944 RepID=UPI00362865D0